ncbi:MAG: HEPN domain-containing protein [Lewinellaceae bacterium]|nr:HEPN domain-containing protein [Lewinellaceae bacterium]
MSFSKEEVAHYRLQRAKEAFAEAEIMRDNQRWQMVVNRLYYASFYAVSAYFVQQGLKAFTHSGLKSAFNKELVQAGKVSLAEGRLFNQLFSYRQDADYKDFVTFDEVEINELFPRVESLITR